MDTKYQIFISSTYEDLKDERREIMEATLSMGHIPAGMELFSAADEEQWKIIQDRIDECDYYVVIVAHRYGSTIETGESYTEKEYRYAQERGVPILRFLIDSDVPWPPQWVDDDPQQRERLDEFKKELMKKPVEFWTSTKDLGGRYSRAFPKLVRSFPRPGWVSGDQVVGPGVLSELARLSHENSELKEQIEALEGHNRSALGELYSRLGREKASLTIRRRFGEGWEELGQISLRRVFFRWAPSMVVEEKTERLAMLVAMSASVPPAELRPDWPYPKNLLDSVLGRLFAFDLVEPSARKHSVNDDGVYWTLTDTGRDLLRYEYLDATEDGSDGPGESTGTDTAADDSLNGESE